MNRLSHLNTVLPSTVAATAAAAAIKEALAGFGNRRRGEPTAAATTVDCAERAREERSGGSNSSSSSNSSNSSSSSGSSGSSGSGDGRGIGVTKGLDGNLARGGVDGGGGGSKATGRGGAGGEDGSGKERHDLGRSIRETVLTMRGLAKLYPLSQSFRWVNQRGVMSCFVAEDELKRFRC